MKNLQSITSAMNRLEEEINRQQRYIAQHGASNDAGPYDKVWEEYKRDAAQNLEQWDAFKAMRDQIKAG